MMMNSKSNIIGEMISKQNKKKNETKQPLIEKKKGYVLMLDILGFKENTEDKYELFLASWQSVKNMVEEAKQNYEKDLGHIYDINRLFMSDTIIICISCKKHKKKGLLYALLIISQIVQGFFINCMGYGIFFRGAVSFGDFIFSKKDNMVMGKALYEAADWYEAVDWMGVLLSPSAEYAYELSIKKIKKDNLVYLAKHLEHSIVDCNKKIPFKDGYPQICSYAINWFYPKTKEYTLDKLYKVFSDIRHSPVFASKYKNCIEFVINYKEPNKEEEKQSNEANIKPNGSPQRIE